MRFGDILVCLDHTASGNQRMTIALALAARSQARLIGYYATPRRGPPAEDFLDVPLTTVIDDKSADFDRQVKLRNVEGTWVMGDSSRTVEDLAKYARCVDLLVAGLGDPDDADSEHNIVNLEKLVIACGRPVLGVPITLTSDKVGKNIMIAWDGSLQASRAMHDALPFLREASSVRLVSIESDPTAIASPNEAVAHLQRMGIPATLDEQIDLQLPIGDEILSRVDPNEIDLLVAGAFGHSRFAEHVVGGASRSLLHQMMVPVLVSH
jgi:nucleotide-binding universal stress UspA family protein